MLVLEHISKAFDGKAVLTDVNLAVPRGATCALIGSSGSGKTTLLRITLRLIAPDQGSVRINDRPLSALGPDGLGRPDRLRPTGRRAVSAPHRR